MKIIYCLNNKREKLGFQIDLEYGRNCYMLLLFTTPIDIFLNNELTHYKKNTYVLYKKGSRTKYSSKQSVLFNSFVLFELDNENELDCYNIKFDTPVTIDQTLTEKLLIYWDELSFHIIFNEVEEGLQIFKKMLSALSSKEHILTLEDIHDKIHNSPGSLSVNEAANLLNYSRVTFTLLYKQKYTITPKEDIIKAKMDLAKSLLEYSNNTVDEIAGKLYYENHSNFIRFFKNETGLTPKAYRKLYRKSF